MTQVSEIPDQATATYLIRDAVRALGRDVVDALVPKPLQLTATIHDTGCQCALYIEADGLAPMAVWQGSVWYSSAYEFNDWDKRLGLNPELEIAADKVAKFFGAVRAALDEHKRIAEEREAQRKAEAERKHRETVNAYRRLLGGA